MVSLNNGIFLCKTCSTQHLSLLSDDISQIKAIIDEEWTEDEMKLLKQGGNPAMRKFFSKYKIPKEYSMVYKYQSVAGYFYRNMLICKRDNLPIQEMPSPFLGIKLDQSAKDFKEELREFSR